MREASNWMRAAGACLVLLAAAAASHGQEEGQVPKKIMKELEYLVGSWRFEGRVGDEKTVGTWSARWAPGKHCLMRHSTQAEEGKTAIGIGVIGWDAATETITEQVFMSNNDSALLHWKVASSEKWEGELTGTMDGEPVEAEIVLAKKGRNEFLYEETTADGEEAEVVLRKLPQNGKKQARIGVPKAALEEMAYRVGEWESTAIVDGVEQPNKGHEVTEWAPGSYSIRIRSSWVEDGVQYHGAGLVGWDCETNQLVEHWFTADGGHGVFRYDLDKQKNAWVGTFSILFGDGRKVEGASIVEKKSRNEWECNTLGLADGKTQTWRSISRRLK